MSTKFRNSFFGFNKEDVLTYVVSTREKENSLIKNNENLNQELNKIKSLHSELIDEFNSLNDNFKDIQKQLEDYKNREESLTRISEGIGKLYLVAQSNATTIINSAKENALASSEAVNNNLEIANLAQNEFDLINSQLTEKAKAFTEEIEMLRSKLEQIKDTISNNNSSIKESEAKLDTLIENVEMEVSK